MHSPPFFLPSHIQMCRFLMAVAWVCVRACICMCALKPKEDFKLWNKVGTEEWGYYRQRIINNYIRFVLLWLKCFAVIIFFCSLFTSLIVCLFVYLSVLVVSVWNKIPLCNAWHTHTHTSTLAHTREEERKRLKTDFSQMKLLLARYEEKRMHGTSKNAINERRRSGKWDVAETRIQYIL